MEKNSTSAYYNKIKALLADKKFHEVLSELKKIYTSDYWESNTLDFIADIGACLVGDDPSQETEDFCQEAFQILAKIGNYKELLMGFLEQLEYLKPNVRFRVLLAPIQGTLLRNSSKRCQSLQWVLNTLQENVQSLPVPKSYGFEDKEKLLLDLDPDMIVISDALVCIIDFYKPFVKESSLWSSNQLDNGQRQILIRFILNLFGKPLALIDLTLVTGASKSTIRNLAETLVVSLCVLESNFYSFYELISVPNNKSPSEDKNKIGISNLALASFMYLVHVEEVHKDHLPCVYSHQYTFEISLPLMCCLLGQSKDSAVHKGLLFSDHILRFVAARNFGDELLDLEECLTFALQLIAIMTEATWQNMILIRKTAKDIFVKYIEKFDYLCRYKIILKLFNCCKHTGVQGLLIQIFKNSVFETLQCMPVLPTFVGARLKKFLKLALILPQGVETDLLEECDRILNALNFVRFLLLRDRWDANITGIWNLTDFLEESFLKPLQVALDLSRTHFEQELKNLKECIKAPVLSSAWDCPTPNLSYDQKRGVLLSSITGLDLIQSIHSLVNEIILTKKQ